MRRGAAVLGAALLAAMAAMAAVTARAASVSPASATVPANLLRVQIHLDAAAPALLDLRRVHLFDTRGVEIERAFLDLPLPSRDGRTLTLLLHPGRIKTGVGPNLQLGPALRAGRTVTLVIDGLALRKRWTVTSAARQRLDPAVWRINTPRSGFATALGVRPNVTLGADARALIAVADADGRRVAGRAELSDDESQWHFVPAQPWRAGRYTLRVHPALEDVAGNRVCAAFEQRALSRADCRTEGRRDFFVGAD
jgi:hypothetical protein